ncbi:hypothetical protein SB764_44330, partial [Paraburkholderia sp. SIMBA_027]
MSPYRFSLVLAVLVSMAPAAQARQTEASVAITPAQPADTVGRIEVLEFFSYSTQVAHPGGQGERQGHGRQR